MPRITTSLQLVASLAAVLTITACSGDDGAEGPQGAQGPQGEQGDTGPQGTPGAPVDNPAIATEIDNSSLSFVTQDVPELQMLDSTGEPSYLIPTDRNGNDLSGSYDITPLLTVGEEVPYLTGEWPNMTPHESHTLAIASIPDGMGLYIQQDDGVVENYWLWVQHEYSSGSGPMSVSTTLDGTITGARVSVFQFNAEGNVVGGFNLIDELLGPTGASEGSVDIDLEAGTVTQTGHQFGRFCSGYLATSGFVNSAGVEVPVWFAPEESGTGQQRGWACFPDGTAQAIQGLGHYAKENIIALNNFRATNGEYSHTVLLSTEDSGNRLDDPDRASGSGGELYMYLGEKTINDPNGFTNGKLFVLSVDGITSADSWNEVNDPPYANEIPTTDTAITWVEVPPSAQVTRHTLIDFVETVDNMGTQFTRLEDLEEDPTSPNTIYLLATGGRNQNPNGTMYKLELDFAWNENNELVPNGGTIKTELEGGMGTGVSYDNLAVDTFGKVVINEDRNGTAVPILEAEGMRHGRVLKYDPADSSVEFLAENDTPTIDPAQADSLGRWESSGIIALTRDGDTESSYIVNVQAHGSPYPNDDVLTLREGGQVLLMTPSAGNGTVVELSGNAKLGPLHGYTIAP